MVARPYLLGYVAYSLMTSCSPCSDVPHEQRHKCQMSPNHGALRRAEASRVDPGEQEALNLYPDRWRACCSSSLLLRVHAFEPRIDQAAHAIVEQELVEAELSIENRSTVVKNHARPGRASLSRSAAHTEPQVSHNPRSSVRCVLRPPSSEKRQPDS